MREDERGVGVVSLCLHSREKLFKFTQVKILF